MPKSYAENKKAQFVSIQASMNFYQAEAESSKCSLRYFQDRLDHYMDCYTTRYRSVGQEYDFASDVNVQHFEFMISQHEAMIESFREKYARCRALLTDK